MLPLSPRERERLGKLPRYSHGTTTLFGHEFHFVDPYSLLQMVDEIVYGDIYAFEADDASAPFIIDACANVGVSIAYFKAMYPEAPILAFEPDADVFNALRSNVAR